MNLTIRSEKLTKEKILELVSEIDLIMGFWPAGKELKFNRTISSPFRTEDAPSFIIGNKYGPITYKDLGDYNFRGNVWQFIKQIEGLQNFNQVIAAVDQRFNLGYTTQKIEGKKVINWTVSKLEISVPPHIQVSTRKFNKQELQYWNSYHQDITDLQREHIYACKEIYRNRKKLSQTEMTFGYYCPDIDKWKLYRPLAPKKVKNSPPNAWKWDNSIGRLDYVEELDKMHGNIGILGKSRKDRMVIRKATGIKAICSVQAEDPAALTDEVLYQIWERCRTKVAVTDSDKKGKEFSWWLCNEHGYIHCNTPDELLEEGINDFADMSKCKGLDAVTRHFRLKGII